jgi:hypothetical protein
MHRGETLAAAITYQRPLTISPTLTDRVRP